MNDNIIVATLMTAVLGGAWMVCGGTGLKRVHIVSSLYWA
jgi:hypothetical protein